MNIDQRIRFENLETDLALAESNMKFAMSRENYNEAGQIFVVWKRKMDEYKELCEELGLEFDTRTGRAK